MPCGGYFPISLEKAHKSAHRLQQWCSAVSGTLGFSNPKSYGWKNIVLIVHIVTLFLNEAKSFSLINAAQILSIPIMENPAVVFIVLIVLIVTHLLSEAMPFSLINVVQILYPQNKNRPSICGDFKPSSFKLGLFVIKNLSIFPC